MSRPKGFKHSEETKKKIGLSNSIALKGNKIWLGKKHSKESRRKMSLAQMGNQHWLGRKHSEETKRKIGLGNKGKIVSKETRLKMSKSAKLRCERERIEKENNNNVG